MLSFYREPLPRVFPEQLRLKPHEIIAARELCKAINNLNRISFRYKGEERIIHPYLIGQHKATGELNLRAYFWDGYTSTQPHSPLDRWRMYKVALTEDIEISDYKFADPDRVYYQYDCNTNPPTLLEETARISMRNQLNPGYHPDDSDFKNYTCRIAINTIFDTEQFRTHTKYKTYFK